MLNDGVADHADKLFMLAAMTGVSEEQAERALKENGEDVDAALALLTGRVKMEPEYASARQKRAIGPTKPSAKGHISARYKVAHPKEDVTYKSEAVESKKPAAKRSNVAHLKEDITDKSDSMKPAAKQHVNARSTVAHLKGNFDDDYAAKMEAFGAFARNEEGSDDIEKGDKKARLSASGKAAHPYDAASLPASSLLMAVMNSNPSYKAFGSGYSSGNSQPPTMASIPVPGAVAVSGPSASLYGDEDDFSLTPQTVTVTSGNAGQSNATVAVSARIVKASEDDDVEELQQQLKQQAQELEQIRKERENVAIAEVMLSGDDMEDDEYGTKKCFHGWRKWIIAAALVAIVVGIVLGVVLPSQASPPSPNEETPTPSPTIPPPEDLVELLSLASLDGGVALQEPSTPQRKALHWLAGNENLENYRDEQKIQRYVLATLYYTTGGDDWNHKTGWLSDEDECAWWIDPKWEVDFCWSGRVQLLALFSNNLVGTVPAELALLSSSVAVVDLGSNALNGTIPSEIALLNKLEALYLDGNALTGTIPSEIGLMMNLYWLHLGGNRLTGTIPSEIGLLTNLTDELNLQENELTGAIPSELCRLTRLVALYLGDNNLSAMIPTEIGLMTTLDDLWLRSNRLSGTIPSEIGQANLKDDLYLNNNTLTGTIPSEIGLLVSLSQLDLSRNDLAGTIPTEMGLLIIITQLSLSYNSLTGPIPSEVGFLTNLDSLYLYNNDLTGTIPSEIGLLTNVEYLHLYNNSLTGDYTCPDYITDCKISCDDLENVTCRSLP